MRQYSGSRSIWHTADGRNIHVEELETSHLCSIINFLRWDAAKDLYPKFKSVSPYTFDFAYFTAMEKTKIHDQIYEHVITWPRLRTEAMNRNVWNEQGNLMWSLKKAAEMYGSEIDWNTGIDWSAPSPFMHKMNVAHHLAADEEKPVPKRVFQDLEKKVKMQEARTSQAAADHDRLTHVIGTVATHNAEIARLANTVDLKTRAAFAKISQLDKAINVVKGDVVQIMKDDKDRHEKLDRHLEKQVQFAKNRMDNHARRLERIEKFLRDNDIVGP